MNSKTNPNRLYPSSQKAHSNPAKEDARKKQAHNNNILVFFFSLEVKPMKKRKQAIIPDRIEKDKAKFASIFSNLLFLSNLYYESNEPIT